MKRYAILHVTTFVVMLPVDLLFLGCFAKGIFIRPATCSARRVSAILFYCRYIAGMLIFFSGSPDASWRSTLLYGAVFGFFCYATFELTSLSLLTHWTWPVVVVDVARATFVTATTLGLLIANRLAPRGWR